MSYDIIFWKLEQPLSVPPVEIYRKLCQGQKVDGLSALPVNAICMRIKNLFAGFDPREKFPLIRTSTCSIEASWSSQHFRFDLRGDWGSVPQEIVQIMAEFECPMYDPQIDKRYDAQQGLCLGDLPNFTKPNSGSRANGIRAKAAELEALRQQVLLRIKENKRKKTDERNS